MKDELVIHWPYLLMAIAMLWFPRQWLRNGGSLFKRRRAPRSSVEKLAGKGSRDPDDKSVHPGKEFLTFRNYIGFAVSGDDVDDYSAGTEIKVGPSLHAGFRYYFEDDIEPQGSYLHLDFAHLDYLKDIRAKDENGDLTETRYPDTRTYNDIRLLFGYQNLSATSNWLFDFYGGIGMRDRHMETVTEHYNTSTGLWSYEFETVDDVVPALFVGVKVGLGW